MFSRLGGEEGLGRVATLAGITLKRKRREVIKRPRL